jgi:ornithine lipid ester-linked acyl 2-hydroxylase
MTSELGAGRELLPESYKDMLLFLFKGSGVWAVLAVVAFIVGFKSTVGSWIYLDFIILPVLFVFRGVLEWMVHSWLYHANPLPILGIRLKTYAVHQHTRHHEAPADLSRILVTYKGVVLPAAIVFFTCWLLFRNTNLAVSIIFWFLTIGFVNEVIHLMCHCNIPHRNSLIRKIVRLHRYHHSHDGSNYYGLSSSLGDRLFGTFPVDIEEPENQDNKTEGLWFAAIEKTEYSGDAPYYFDKEKFPLIKEIENQSEKIRKEVMDFLSRRSDAFSPYFGELVRGSPEKWITLPLRTWGIDYHVSQNDFPVTCEAIKRIPGVVSVSLNMLRAGGEIPEHFGDTNATTRVHLGLVIPASLPTSGIKVGNEEMAWEEGKVIMFCDAHYHRAWNHSTEGRLILLLDVIRPEFMPYKRRVCSIIVASFLFQVLILRVPFLKSAIVDNSGAILKFSAPVVSVLIPIYNRGSYLLSRVLRMRLRLLEKVCGTR